MHTGYHARTGDAASFPVSPAQPVLSYSPLIVDAPGRQVPLEVRVTFPLPLTGQSQTSETPLPILLFSHGHGPSNSLSSLEGYAPLVEFFAAHGFAVIQPTHLSSRFLDLPAPTGSELHWKDRPEDMRRILDDLETVETLVFKIAQRKLDRERVAIAGHSFGAWTSCMLLGASNTDPRDGSKWYNPESRIKAGVIIGGLGHGGKDISESGKNYLPWADGEFSKMSTPALVMMGDEDVSPHLTVRDAYWHADSYYHSSGPKDLLVLKGCKHGFGGIAGWDAAETQDEGPELLATVQRTAWAYLWSQLYGTEEPWSATRTALSKLDGIGTLESRT